MANDSQLAEKDSGGSVKRANACALCDIKERSICADLAPRELAQVEQIMARRSVVKNRAMMSEGEPNDSLFVIVQGSFRLSKYLDDGRRQVTGFLFPGDFAGVRPTKVSAYTAEAMEDSLVCHFPHRFLEEALENSANIKDRLIARGQTEYHKAQDHIVLLGKKTAQERVLSFLDLIDRSIGSRRGTDRYIPLPMSRQDIADFLGLRLETLSRTLAGLRRRGVIEELTRRSVLMAHSSRTDPVGVSHSSN